MIRRKKNSNYILSSVKQVMNKINTKKTRIYIIRSVLFNKIKFFFTIDQLIAAKQPYSSRFFS